MIAGCVGVPLGLYWGWGGYPWYTIPITGLIAAVINIIFEHESISSPLDALMTLAVMPVIWSAACAVPYLVGIGLHHLIS